MVGHINAFLDLLTHALPGLVEAFESIRSSFLTGHEGAALQELYSGIRSTSFSDDVLSMQTKGIAVMRATGLGWSDLGEPSRVRSLIERKGAETTREVRPAYGETDVRLIPLKAQR